MLAQHSSRYILGLPSSLLILLHCDLLLCFKPRWQYEGYSFCLQICSFAQHLICCQSPIFPQFQRIKKREEQHRVIMKSERSHGLPWWLSGKESACSVRTTGDVGSIHGSGRSPGGGIGNPLQYSCLGNPMVMEPGGLQPMGSQKSWIQLSH